MYPEFFDPASLGKSLREVTSDILPSGHKNIRNRWFHGAKECDLFIWTDREQNVLKQQISFYGQVVEWNVVEGLKTGLIIEEEADQMVAGSEIVRFDQQPQGTPIAQAIALLKHMTELNESEKRVLLGNFEDPRAGTNLPAEEFIRRFGTYIGEPVNAPRKRGFWARFKAWFKS